MRLHYDKKEDALYIGFNENPYQESEEIQDGIIFDYDKKGKIIGIEILDASSRFPARFRDEFKQSKMPVSLTVA
jgi:uncharacterized protein YuzE